MGDLAQDKGQAVFAELHQTVEMAEGVKLFTVSALDHAAGVSRRAYTSDSNAYPVTGTKPMTPDAWSERVLDRGETFVANTTAEFSPYFPDHAQINALGCQSAVNIPVMHNGHVFGTVNLLDVEHHFTADRVERLKAMVAARRVELILALKSALG